jgi:hypothetical protein
METIADIVFSFNTGLCAICFSKDIADENYTKTQSRLSVGSYPSELSAFRKTFF